METGTKVGFIAILEGELSGMVFDSRWMLALILLCVMADFRFGWADSSKRYNEAKAAGNAVLMDKYKWHTSRAWRRTMNKLMDYIVWVIMGQIVGMAALRPFGIDYTYGGVRLENGAAAYYPDFGGFGAFSASDYGAASDAGRVPGRQKMYIDTETDTLCYFDGAGLRPCWEAIRLAEIDAACV